MKKFHLLLVVLFSSSTIFLLHSQTPFDEDIFQIAFRKEIMKKNKVVSATVFGFSDNQPDTTVAYFDTEGNETSGQFFTHWVHQKLEGLQFVRDSLDRVVLTIYPSKYNAKEARITYSKRKISQTTIWNDTASANTVFTRFYDKKMNLVKETREFSYGTLVFKFRYNRKNLLTKIIDADGKVQKVVYTFYE